MGKAYNPVVPKVYDRALLIIDSQNDCGFYARAVDFHDL